MCYVLSWLHGLQPANLLCPWNFPGKNTIVGCHFLLQGVFPIQAWNSYLLCLLHWQADSLPVNHSNKTSGLNITHLFVAVLEARKPEVKVHAAFSFWWKLSSGLQMATLSSHGLSFEHRLKEISAISSSCYQSTLSIRLDLTQLLSPPQRSHFQIQSDWKLRLQHHEFWKDANMQSITEAERFTYQFPSRLHFWTAAWLNKEALALW